MSVKMISLHKFFKIILNFAVLVFFSNNYTYENKVGYFFQDSLKIRMF